MIYTEVSVMHSKVIKEFIIEIERWGLEKISWSR